jgi:hypothetical protein
VVSGEPAQARERIDIIRTVQTPLGFFVLVVLVVEAILGVTAASDSSNRAVLVAGMLGLIFLLVGIVAFMAYRRPEALLGVRPPEQAQGVTGTPGVQQVKDPRVLCAAAPKFMPNGFERDTEILRKVFGRRVRVAGNLKAETLRHLLTSEEFDIVHLAVYVDPSDGALVLDGGNQQERISAQGLANLLEVCKAKVIVLAVCDSIILAAHVSRQANVIAATTTMRVEPFIQWATCFYNLLARGHALSRAYDIARATTDTPMVLLMKQDLTFTGVKA